MKTIVSALILTALLSTAVNADQGKGKKGANIDQVISSLQLDANTSSNLKALMEKHRAERKASREQKSKDRTAKQAARKQHRDALLALLGYEKMYEFDEIMSANRSKRKGKGKRGDKS